MSFRRSLCALAVLLQVLLLHIASAPALPTPVEGPWLPAMFRDPFWNVANLQLSTGDADVAVRLLRSQWTEHVRQSNLELTHSERLAASLPLFAASMAHHLCSGRATARGPFPQFFGHLMSSHLTAAWELLASSPPPPPPFPPVQGPRLPFDPNTNVEEGDGPASPPGGGMSFDTAAAAPLAKVRGMLAYARSPALKNDLMRHFAASTGVSLPGIGPRIPGPASSAATGSAFLMRAGKRS